MVFMRATLSSFNIKFRSFGNLRQNRPLSFVSRIILSLVEVLFFKKRSVVKPFIFYNVSDNLDRTTQPLMSNPYVLSFHI